MDNDIKTWLYDILQSIKEIDSYYDNKPRIFKEYVADIKTMELKTCQPRKKEQLLEP